MKKLMFLAPLALAACVNSDNFDKCPDAALYAAGYTLLHPAGVACIRPGMALADGAVPAALAIGVFALGTGLVALP